MLQLSKYQRHVILKNIGNTRKFKKRARQGFRKLYKEVLKFGKENIGQLRFIVFIFLGEDPWLSRISWEKHDTIVSHLLKQLT